MFGIAQPCRHTLSPELRRQWMSHLCGLCLGLRDHEGQAARVTTNVDAVVLSILVEAQRDEPLARREAGPCPLRAMRSVAVVRADEPATGHAVSVSLTMAATKLHDHALDGDGLAGRAPRLAGRVARRWEVAGARQGRVVAFDTGRLRAAVADSGALERQAGLSLDDYLAPTERAAAAACRHTAVLAGRPDNAEALDRIGRAFGRITYLVDAVDDADDDRAHGRFNALVAAAPDAADRQALASRLLHEAHRDLIDAFDELDLVRGDLARAVLVDQLARVIRRCLRHGAAGPYRHEESCSHRAGAPLATAARTTGALSRLALAVGLAFPGFRPGVGPGGGGEVPPTVPGLSPEELAEAERRRQQGQEPLAEQGSGCCDGFTCCCCCGDGCDCCADGCDCCDCCDC